MNINYRKTLHSTYNKDNNTKKTKKDDIIQDLHNELNYNQ